MDDQVQNTISLSGDCVINHPAAGDCLSMLLLIAAGKLSLSSTAGQRELIPGTV